MVEVGRSDHWLYRIDDNSETIELKHATGLLSDRISNDIKTKSAIKEIAKRDFKKIGLDPDVDTTLEILVDRLVVTYRNKSDETVNKILAHKVRVFRKIGKQYVDNADILLSYFVDGSLQKMTMRWPHIEAQTAFLDVSEQDLPALKQKMKQQLKTHPFGKYVKNLKASTSFTIENGQLKRSLKLTKPYENDYELRQYAKVVF